MNATNFPQSNLRLTAPDGMTEEQCHALHVFADGDQCISRWEPTAEDLERILNGGPVWLSVWAGATQPPVRLFTEDPFPPGEQT